MSKENPKCRYVETKDIGNVLIPGCYSVVMSGDIEDCCCPLENRAPRVDNKMFLTMSISKGGIEVKLSVLAKDEATALAMAEKEANDMLEYGDELIHSFVLFSDMKVWCMSRTTKEERKGGPQ